MTHKANSTYTQLIQKGIITNKKLWGDLKALWVPPDTRDEIVDFVGYWSRLTGIYISTFIQWIGISSSKFCDWKERYGKVNEHNHWIPRDFWLETWEKEAIMEFFLSHPHKRSAPCLQDD